MVYEVTIVRLDNGDDACHASNCADLKKPANQDVIGSWESLAVVEAQYKQDGIDDGEGEDAYWGWVRVMPCVNKKGK